jgi:hypothetical protein
VSPDTSSRVFQRLELEVIGRQASLSPIFEQPLTVGRHEMRHRRPPPDVTMEPQASLHREDHPVAA